MDATAQLGGEVANLHYTHALAILLTEQRHRLELIHGYIDGHIFQRHHGCVAQHLAIDDVFNVLQLFVSHAGEVGEVAAPPSRRSQRACLLHVRA